MRFVLVTTIALAAAGCGGSNSQLRASRDTGWTTAGGFSSDPNSPAETNNLSTPPSTGTPQPGGTGR